MNIKNACAAFAAGVLSLSLPLVASAQISQYAQQQLAPLATQLVAILGQMSQAQAQGAAYLNSAAYQQQVSAWSAQLAAIQSQLVVIFSSGQVSVATAPLCPQLSRDLELGMQGEDVASLQRFLSSDSSAHFTGTANGFFDTLTIAGVQNFQSVHGIASSGSWNTNGFGRVGGLTRSIIANVCANGNGRSFSPTGTISTTNTSNPFTTVITVPPTIVTTPLIVPSNSSSGSFLAQAVSNVSSNSVNFLVTANPNASCSATTFILSFGDGGQQSLNFAASCSSQTQPVLHTYSGTGNFSVTLQSGAFQTTSSLAVPIGGNPNNSGVAAGGLTVSAAPGTDTYAVNVTASGSPNTSCSAYSAKLTFGDGAQQTINYTASCATQTQTLPHTYAAAGTYQIVLSDSANHSSSVNFTTASVPSAGTGDPATMLSINGEGVDNSKVFTDTSVHAHVMTTIGAAAVDTGAYAVGSASVYLDGTSAIATPAHADFNFGSGAFTEDLWFASNGVLNSGTSQAGLILQAGSDASDPTLGGAGLELFGDQLAFVGSIGGTVYHPFYSNTVLSSHITDGAWHHGAVVRSGNTVTLFLDGISQGSITVAGSAHASTNALTIGRYGEYNGNYFKGWVDQIDIAKGKARWTSNFNPISGQPVVTPSDPTGLIAQCNSAGTQATFSWDSSANALSYSLLLDDTSNNSSACVLGWLCAGSTDQRNNDGSLRSTSYTATVVPEHLYSWAVAADSSNAESNVVGGSDFTCHAPGGGATDPASACVAQGGVWNANGTCGMTLPHEGNN